MYIDFKTCHKYIVDDFVVHCFISRLFSVSVDMKEPKTFIFQKRILSSTKQRSSNLNNENLSILHGILR